MRKKFQSCLSKLKLADEIFVILDKTTDNSKKIALNYTKKNFEGSWELEGKRRNFGLKKCLGDWILEIDADEHVPDILFLEIRDKIKNAEPGYFLIPFDNYVGGRKVTYGWGAHGEYQLLLDFHIKDTRNGIILKEYIRP